jgi:GAF domain-containing protein
MKSASDRDKVQLTWRRQLPKSLQPAVEHELNVIVHHAAAAVGTRMALISLFEDGRRWFTARVGAGLSDVPISSLCTHAMSGGGVLVVLDASSDTRFAHDSLVAGGPRIRFYAGAALRLDGVIVGALSVLDDQPRHLLPTPQADYLTYLANRTVAALDKRIGR